MIPFLFVAVSLLTQAFIFRNLDDSYGNTEVNIEESYFDSTFVMDPAYGLTGKSDSSRTMKLASDR